jgi:hypothetical protein
MTTEQAETIFHEYSELLRDEEKRGSRRSPTLLPASRETVMRAIKILVARLYYRGIDNENTLRNLLQGAMFLDTFSDEAFDSLNLIDSMQKRRREIVEFYQELLNIRRDETFFWQRVYALAGVSCDTKRTTFFEHIRQRLGVTAKTHSTPTTPER